MIVRGAGIRENVLVDRPVESVDLVPTLGSLFGFSPQLSQGKALPEVL
jgi:arylsulfatase A-like enzyme